MLLCFFVLDTFLYLENIKKTPQKNCDSLQKKGPQLIRVESICHFLSPGLLSSFTNLPNDAKKPNASVLLIDETMMNVARHFMLNISDIMNPM